jgi:hypothetical protein
MITVATPYTTSPVPVDAALHGGRVIWLSSTNGPGFELLTDAVIWAEVNWLNYVEWVPPVPATTEVFKIF